MSKVFVISDTHFGHSATFENFKCSDGSPLRPFSSLKEMHATIIDNWNYVVSSGDLVLHCGDVSFSGQAHDEVLPQLNGKKYLIRGNHDRFSESRYRRHFSRVFGCYVRDNYVFTHIPIHPDSCERWLGNIHGHLHANKIASNKYFNVSVEQINYTPMDFEDIKLEIASG